MTLTFMFPKFTQVGLYSRGGGGGYIQGVYIRDVNWGDIYSQRGYLRGRNSGVLGVTIRKKNQKFKDLNNSSKILVNL